MRLIIDIPENEYRQIKEYYEKNDDVEATYSYIYHGTPLEQEPKIDSIPILKGTTNGDMWLKVFGGKAVEMTYNIVIVQQGKIERRFNKDWWDAPYERSIYGRE